MLVMEKAYTPRLCETEVDSSPESEYVSDIWQALKVQSSFTTG